MKLDSDIIANPKGRGQILKVLETTTQFRIYNCCKNKHEYNLLESSINTNYTNQEGTMLRLKIDINPIQLEYL